MTDRDADHVCLQETLERLAEAVEAVWLSADGVPEACDLYGRPGMDHSHLRIGPPSWVTRRS